jgi:hypothetical protein
VFSYSVFLYAFITYSYIREHCMTHVAVAVMVMVTGGIQILVHVVSLLRFK